MNIRNQTIKTMERGIPDRETAHTSQQEWPVEVEYAASLLLSKLCQTKLCTIISAADYIFQRWMQ